MARRARALRRRRARPPRARAASPSGCRAATRPRRAWCARSTPRASSVADLQLHAPTLDDVFLAKTGRSLEGAGDDDEERRGGDRRAAAVERRSRRRVSTASTQILEVALARRSVLRTLRQPAQIVPSLIFPLFLLAVNTGGSTRPPTSPASRPTPT